MFDGCYNERVCDHTGIPMPVLKALTLKYKYCILSFFSATHEGLLYGTRFHCNLQSFTTADHEVRDIPGRGLEEMKLMLTKVHNLHYRPPSCFTPVKCFLDNMTTSLSP